MVSEISRTGVSPARVRWLTARTSMAACTLPIVSALPRVSPGGAVGADADTGLMTVFALLAGIAIGVALGYLLARTRLGTAAATATERARAAQERAAILGRTAADKMAIGEGEVRPGIEG